MEEEFYYEVDYKTWKLQLEEILRKNKKRLDIIKKMLELSEIKESKELLTSFLAVQYHKALAVYVNNKVLLELGKDRDSSLYYISNGLPILVTVSPKLKKMRYKPNYYS